MKTYTFRIKQTFHDKEANIIRKPTDKPFIINDEKRALELMKLPYVKLISEPKAKPTPASNKIIKNNKPKTKAKNKE